MVVMGGLSEIDEIVARLKEAVRTLRALRVSKIRPAGFKAAWPDVVRQAFEAFNPDEVERTRLARTVPGPAQISRMDEAISWLVPLSEHQRVLVFARVSGAGWRALERRFGKVERRLRDDYIDALVAISARRKPQRKKILA